MSVQLCQEKDQSENVSVVLHAWIFHEKDV